MFTYDTYVDISRYVPDGAGTLQIEVWDYPPGSTISTPRKTYKSIRVFVQNGPPPAMPPLTFDILNPDGSVSATRQFTVSALTTGSTGVLGVHMNGLPYTAGAVHVFREKYGYRDAGYWDLTHVFETTIQDWDGCRDDWGFGHGVYEYVVIDDTGVATGNGRVVGRSPKIAWYRCRAVLLSDSSRWIATGLVGRSSGCGTQITNPSSSMEAWNDVGDGLSRMIWSYGIGALLGEGVYVTLEGASALARTGSGVMKEGYSMGGIIGTLTVGTGVATLGTGVVMGGVAVAVGGFATYYIYRCATGSLDFAMCH